MNALRIINRNHPLCLVQLDQEVYHHNKCNYEAEENPEDGWVNWKLEPTKEVEIARSGSIEECSAEAGNSGWKLGNNRSKDNHRDTVADTLLSDELTKPHQDNGACGHSCNGESPVFGGWNEFRCDVCVKSRLIKNIDICNRLNNS